MMSGYGWADIFIQDPITKETQKLGVVEELTAKILEPKYCVVMDTGLSYSMYDDWIMHNFDEYRDNFIYDHDIEDIQKDRLYRIIGHAPHGDHKQTELYLIQDMDTEQVFIIEEEGIEKCNDVSVLTQNIDTITVDCSIQRSVYENMLKGEERNMNNKIVDLYYERKKKELLDKYEKIINNEYEENEAVKEYTELKNTFETALAEMADRYNHDELRIIVRTGYVGGYPYELNDNIKDEIKKAHREEYNAELKQLELLVEEVRAQLSLSDDKDYQIDILTRYDIINKKGKLNV